MWYSMQHIERGTLRQWAFLDIDENIQKIIQKKEFSILFLIVKLYQFW